MIRDLSETLKAVLHDPGFATQFPELAGADIVFDRPQDAFAPAKTTVDLFLYDVRENTVLRSNEFTSERKNGQVISHPPALRLDCSYLVTAWPVGGVELALQEHRLLTQVLRVLYRYPTIPTRAPSDPAYVFLKGSLLGQDPPLPMVALHPDALKNLAEFWSSLGAKQRASLTVTVSISVPVFADFTDFAVTTHTTNYTHGTSPQVDSFVHVGGLVVGPAKDGIAGALVDILDAGLRDTTDGEGRFNFIQVPTGQHTVRVVAAGFQQRTRPLSVPGRPEDYVFTLVPL